MAGTLDSFLNFLVPTLIILVVIGFIWTRLLSPSIGPWLRSLWDSAGERGQQMRGKAIVYGDEL